MPKETNIGKARGSNRSLTGMPGKFPEMGERLNKIKDDLGITWDDMARELGNHITSQTLANIGRGASNMSPHVMRALKATYKVTYDYLIDGGNTPKLLQRKESVDDRINRVLKAIEDAIKKTR